MPSTSPIDVYVALVEEVMEHVERLHRRRSLLLVAEDQVDPQVQVLEKKIKRLTTVDVNAAEAPLI